MSRNERDAEHETASLDAEEMRAETLDLLQRIRSGLSEADRQAIRKAAADPFDEIGQLTPPPPQP